MREDEVLGVEAVPEAEECAARDDGYVCTLARGHAGAHRAHDGASLVHTWEDEPAVMATQPPPDFPPKALPCNKPTIVSHGPGRQALCGLAAGHDGLCAVVG